MRLFRRILLSIFPEVSNMDTQYNPANMFINFISPKHYFSVVLRRLAENYKLNLFDISLNSFEVKIGFGDNPGLKLADIENYYSYINASSLNGRRYFSISNVGSSVSLAIGKYIIDIFRGKDFLLYLNFLISIYLLSFVFAAKMKNFGKNLNKKKQYDRFIKLFFSFYELTNQQTGLKLTPQQRQELKVELLKKIEVFFFLFEYYQRLYNLFNVLNEDIKDFFQWLFYDEIKEGKYKFVLDDYFKNLKKYTNSVQFSTTEKTLLNLIFPADILIRFFLDAEDIFMIVDDIVGKIYSYDKIKDYLNSFLNGNKKFEEFITYITDYRLFKKNFVEGLKSYFVRKFKNEDIMEDFESEMDSFIGEEDMLIPERIKKESIITERLLNFYVSFLGGFWISRADNFYIRLIKQNLLKQLKENINLNDLNISSLNFYSGLMYLYTKNVFYYKEAFENIRAGKVQFKLPIKATFKEVYSSSAILNLFNEAFLISLFEYFSIKDIKIYVKNSKLIDLFKKQFLNKISTILKYDNNKLLEYFFGTFADILEIDKNKFIDILLKNFNEEDYQRFKFNFYSLDFWISQDINEFIFSHKEYLQVYSISHRLGLLFFLKETLYGLVIYLYYLSVYETKFNKNININALLNIYLEEILHLDVDIMDVFKSFILQVFEKYKSILEYMYKLDDNKDFLDIGLNNRLILLQESKGNDIHNFVKGEDIIWFKDYLRAITYYNKRYFIPN